MPDLRTPLRRDCHLRRAAVVEVLDHIGNLHSQEYRLADKDKKYDFRVVRAPYEAAESLSGPDLDLGGPAENGETRVES